MSVLKVHEIIPGRVLQRGRFDRLSLPRKKKELERLGVSHVACVIRGADRELMKLFGARYFHWPVADGKLPPGTAGVLLEAAARLGDILEASPSRILVHCQAGRNRSSLLSGLLCVRALGMCGGRAVEYLRSRRPGALSNEHFVRFLRGIIGYDPLLGYIRRGEWCE